MSLQIAAIPADPGFVTQMEIQELRKRSGVAIPAFVITPPGTVTVTVTGAGTMPRDVPAKPQATVTITSLSD
jgi:hypothetical protein